MKNPILFIFFILLSPTVLSQDKDFENKIITGVYTNTGINQPVRLTRKYVTEDVGPFHGGFSWSAGLKLSGMVSQKMRIEFAACYSVHKAGFELSPPIYPESKIYPETIKTFNLPVTLYRYMNNDFFLSAGTIIDFEIPGSSYWIDSQTGIGFTIGAGKEFHIQSFVIDIVPNLELHTLIPFDGVKYQQRLLVFGLKLGLGYCFRERGKNESNVTLSTTNF
jgi:hypothetical protein